MNPDFFNNDGNKDSIHDYFGWVYNATVRSLDAVKLLVASTERDECYHQARNTYITTENEYDSLIARAKSQHGSKRTQHMIDLVNRKILLEKEIKNL